MEYSTHHELPETIDNVINEFYSCNDEDIKYMILKKTIQWNTIDDLTRYLNKIIIPIFREGESNLIDLLSFEILPQLFKDNLELFIGLVFEPLLTLFLSLNNEGRKSSIIQCFKNILVMSVEKNKNFVPRTKVAKDYVTLYDQALKINNFHISHRVLYRGVFRLLVRISYKNEIPVELMAKILKDTSGESKLDPTTSKLLNESFELVKCENIPFIYDIITFPQLLVLSERWYKFNRVPKIYEKFMMDSAEEFINKGSDRLYNFLTIIQNMKPFLTLKSYKLGKLIVDWKDVQQLREYLVRIKEQLLCIRKERFEHSIDAEKPSYQGHKELYDEDIAQENYLNELQFNIDDFEEGEDPFNLDADFNNVRINIEENNHDYLSKELSKIDDILQDLVVCNYSITEEVTMKDNKWLQINQLINILSTTTDLNELSSSITCVEKFIKDPFYSSITPNLHNELYKALLTRLRKNKEFIKVIKVGNMKQYIDEGQDIRISIYNLLLQTSDNLLYYNIGCLILDAIITFGVKEQETSTLTQISTLFKKIFKKYGHYLEGLDPDWLNNEITPVIANPNLKIYGLS